MWPFFSASIEVVTFRLRGCANEFDMMTVLNPQSGGC